MFTAMLVSWIIIVIVAVDLGDKQEIEWVKLAGLIVALLAVSVAISRFTIRLLVRPLALLQEGIHEARAGRLKKVQISRTGDEIEYLGESFNQMIASIEASQAQVREYQELLEERILQRTEQLETALRAALSASQAKSEFLANVSHELRTPMTGVIGMLDLALASRLTPEQRDQLTTAQNCAHALLELLNDLLDLSKAEAGKMSLEEIPFDVRQLVGEAVKPHEVKAAAKGVRLTWNLDRGLPRMLVGDPLRFRQIIANLLSNAVKFTADGHVSLAVAARGGAEAEPRMVEIRVTDSGIGIAKDKQQAIFEKFTQADGSVSRKYGGTGLGLAITKKLTELQGGSIELQSEPGVGSVFTVKLPLAAVDGQPTSPVAGVEPAAERPIEAQPGRILLVEDNLINQRVVVSLLSRRGYEVDVANNGVEALERLEGGMYDLVLMDVQMPLMDGLEATRRIRAEPRYDGLPVVAMTAHAMNGDQERCLASGMDAYLAKPVDHRRLVGMIEHYLAARRTGAATERGMQGTGAVSDPALVRQMASLFLQLAPERMRRMGSAVEARDVEALLQDAAKLQHAAESIEAVDVAEHAKLIAGAAIEQDFERAMRSLAELEGELSRLSGELRPSV